MGWVFLVERHACFREGLAVVLGGEPDLTVVGQADPIEGAKACAAAARACGADAAVVGLGPPPGSGQEDAAGEELIRALRGADRPVAVLALTSPSLDPERLASALRKAGANEVLTKEAGLEEIIAAVRRLRHEESPMRRASSPSFGD